MSSSSDASKPSSANSNRSGFLAWSQRRIFTPLRRFGDLPPLAAIRDALPWSFIGLVAAIALFMIVEPVHAKTLGAEITGRLAQSLLPALAIMAATLVVILAIVLARRLGHARLPFVLACVAAFALALPRNFDPHQVFTYLRLVGGAGLFLAIVVCLAVAFIFSAIARVRIPAGMQTAVACAVVIAISLALFATHVSLTETVLVLMQPLGRLGDTYVALLVIVLVETLLWLAGIHGPAMLAAVVTPVYLTLQAQNAHAFAAGQPLPHIVVVSLFLFVFPGGAGATLPLAVLLALSRAPRLRAIGRLTLVPALFNANEPLMFGLPVVFNPFLAIPFVLAPVVLASSTYAAVAFGWVARPAFYYPASFTTPVSTYLATLDVRALVLVAINIALATIIYLPFVRAYEKHELSLT